MTKSLQEQLLNAGLVDQKRADALARSKKEERARHKSQPKKKKSKRGRGGPPDPAREEARRAQAEKTARDRTLNQQKQERARRASIKAEIKQLVREHRLDRGKAEVIFNFIEGKDVRRIHVTPEQQRSLAAGELAVVRAGARLEVVPAAVLDKLRARDPACVLVHHADGAEAVQEDDPYAAYQVPDDLQW